MKPRILRKPPIKYYGGKQKMLPYILPLIPAHNIYVEPFAGGLSVFFAKQQAKVSVVNDINGNVANFYKVMKCGFESLCVLIEQTLYCEFEYNRAKEIYHTQQKGNHVERAWALWMCANFSYGGEVGGTFQWVKNKNDNWSPAVSMQNRKAQFKEYSGRLEKTMVFNRDGVDIINSYSTPDVFQYIDTPYVGARQGHYTGYRQEEYNKTLKACADTGSKFLMSSYDNDELNKYTEKHGWKQKRIGQRVGVSGKGGRKVEVLTWNYNDNTTLQFN